MIIMESFVSGAIRQRKGKVSSTPVPLNFLKMMSFLTLGERGVTCGVSGVHAYSIKLCI